MRFRSIEIANFRQFAETFKIDFSEDSNKNITVIIGNNGAGKTTLLQAFRWCLYGEVNLVGSDILYNKSLFDEANTNQMLEVKVSIEIEKDGDLYKLTRIQNYVKTSTNTFSTKLSYPSATVKRKNIGNYTSCSVTEVFRIIPKELSTYFLFDGERMKNLSENSTQGKKDIKVAVTSILGIDILNNSIEDIRYAVRSFKAQKQSDDSSQMNSLNKTIKSRLELVDQKSSENDDFRKQINENTLQIDKIDEYLLSSKIVEEKVKQRKMLEADIKSLNARSNTLLTNLYQFYSENSFPVYLESKLLDGMDLIGRMKIDDKAIVGIDSKAINLILERGYCICGNSVRSDSIEKEHLVHLLDFVPPKSLSGLLSTFNSNVERYKEDAEIFKKKFSDLYMEYSDCLQKIDEYERDLSIIDEDIKNVDIDVISSNQKTRASLKNKTNVLLHKIGENNKTINDARKQLEKYEKLRDEISVNNEHNKRVEKKIRLCNEVLSKFEKEIKTYELSIRESLQSKVNELSNRIFTMKRTISIEANYDFRFKSTSGLEILSEGEMIMASFATVSAIIEVAKMNNIILRSETYPLVMDAPFAKLDDSHRKRVAEFIPRIAEQIILFTVDSQWNGTVEVAMQPYIGKAYEINQVEIGISRIEVKK